MIDWLTANSSHTMPSEPQIPRLRHPSVRAMVS